MDCVGNVGNQPMSALWNKGHRVGTRLTALLHYSLLNKEPGMDRQVEERVTVEIAAVFPLTARINHSCAPKAEVRSQEFIDCTMDLVAITDVEKGEEIIISYILRRAGEQSRRKRQRELQAKYLVICDCERCKEDS